MPILPSIDLGLNYASICSPPSSCGGPAPCSGWSEDLVRTSAASVYAPPRPAASDSSGAPPEESRDGLLGDIDAIITQVRPFSWVIIKIG